MRVMPSRYSTQARPVQIKRQVSQLQHVQAPLKGLSLTSKLKTSDPLLAPILDNFIVEEDRITCRAGYKLLYTNAAAKAVACLVPWYGPLGKLAAATDGKLIDIETGTVLKSGFGSDDWHWTSFSNLSDTDYTILVNGVSGVWSWNGGSVVDPPPVAATSLVNANPARIYVATADIGKFQNGTNVIVAGATGDMVAANGTHQITSVNVPANSITLVGVDLSAATAPQTTGVTVNPPAAVMQENVTAPAGATHIRPAQFQVVMSHMNRLWFADNTNLALYYLPLQQKSGQVKELPLNAIFKRGGSIRAIYTWTVDGGMGLDDQLVIFTTNGEAAIYGGTDPDTDLTLTGVYRFDSPMSKHSVVQYGGELYVLISTGLVPMSTLMKAESENLGKQDTNIFTLFEQTARTMRTRPGWAAFLNHSSGRLFCNLPLGAQNSYRQLVRFMPNPIWASWSNLPARCWGWIDNRVFFGSDTGKVYELNPAYLSDNGQPIKVDVQPAWSAFKTPATKQFKMIKPYIITDGVPRPLVDIRVDYDTSPPFNQPDVSEGAAGSEWDVSDWDTSDWASPVQQQAKWTGVAAIGRVGAPRMVALIKDCTFSVSGWDVIYESGSVL